MFDYSSSVVAPNRIVVPLPEVTCLILVTGLLSGYNRLPDVVQKISSLLRQQAPPQQSRHKLAVLFVSPWWEGQWEMGHCQPSVRISGSQWESGRVLLLPHWDVIWRCGGEALFRVRTSDGALKMPLVHPASARVRWELFPPMDGYSSPHDLGDGYSDEALVAQINL